MLAGASLGFGADLSPGNWPKAEREQVEKLESQTVSPKEKKSIESSGGIISATVSPLSVYAGIQALRAGGSAADAAATVALTQVTTQLGSFVSYAGVFTMLYFDAKAHKVYSMDAGFNSYLNETDPKTIPVCDLGPLSGFPGQHSVGAGDKGRETLVPGFMAGVEAMHRRFGRLPFGNLFQPALWYAERGIRISPMLQGFFLSRAGYLSRTPEGREFLCGGGSNDSKAKDSGVRAKVDSLLLGGNHMPLVGDVFLQPGLTKTLKAVSDQGSRYMYTGLWAEDFVRIVQREGGKVTAEDLKRYEPLWTEPYKENVFGHTVYVNGPPHRGAHALFAGLNLAEALRLDQQKPYWKDPESFRILARLTQFVATAPAVGKEFSQVLKSKGVDISPEGQLGKGYARAVALLFAELATPQQDDAPKHSDGIVVVDKDGNIAAITHSINTVIWGDTGIVVDGIPVPDSAGFQQTNLARIKPGDRVLHDIIDTISFEGEAPVLATGSIGSSLVAESIRVLLGILGQRQNLPTMMAAPPLLSTFDAAGFNNPLSRQTVSLPRDAYGPDFIARLKALGLTLNEMATTTAVGKRGTLAAVALDPRTSKRTAADDPGVMVFNQAE